MNKQSFRTGQRFVEGDWRVVPRLQKMNKFQGAKCIKPVVNMPLILRLGIGLSG